MTVLGSTVTPPTTTRGGPTTRLGAAAVCLDRSVSGRHRAAAAATTHSESGASSPDIAPDAS
eukprot:CAMPEP_0185703368 /NCGR_PEP_ID=MMETSP1164-20130828/14327_1 /TAXON_ID=1104430 /ORGANISM="Chrysoreinhardia sp, Strain CCMP2950" /LENGTH=61 /DNA_ID=CAMNT_0028370653 /DNA_START=227 /DNA_END=412 /DNA_ORIENTATION=-